MIRARAFKRTTAGCFFSLATLGVALSGCLGDYGLFSGGGAGGGGSSPGTGSFGDCFAGKCDDGDPCTLDTCDIGVCTHWVVEDGSAVPAEGDDPHDCVEHVCVGGRAVAVALPDGSKCGAAQAFDCAAGKCGCSAPADCGDDAECAKRTCDAGPAGPTCGWDYAPEGALAPGQPHGDCERRVCTGSSAVAKVEPDADPEDDANPCTTDVCDASGGTTHTPAAPGAPCGPGKECGGAALAGTCCATGPDVCAGKCGVVVDACGVAKTCPTCGGSKPVCVANVCVQCATDADCASLPDKKHCASVGPKIGECVQCDLPGADSPDCEALGGDKTTCKNDHKCG